MALDLPDCEATSVGRLTKVAASEERRRGEARRDGWVPIFLDELREPRGDIIVLIETDNRR
jgi:hypothetical protein